MTLPGLGLGGFLDLDPIRGSHERHPAPILSSWACQGFLGRGVGGDNWCLRIHLSVRLVLMALFNNETPQALPVPPPSLFPRIDPLSSFMLLTVCPHPHEK